MLTLGAEMHLSQFEVEMITVPCSSGSNAILFASLISQYNCSKQEIEVFQSLLYSMKAKKSQAKLKETEA